MKHVLLMTAVTLAMHGSSWADQALATSKNCMSCHSVANKIVGPSFKDIAKKYAGNAKAVDTLSDKIIKGGGGVWGSIPMPANPQVTPAEAKKITAWILTHK